MFGHSVELYRGMVRGSVRVVSRVRSGWFIKMSLCYVWHSVELYRGMVRGWVRVVSRVRSGWFIKMSLCYVWPQCGTISGYG